MNQLSVELSTAKGLFFTATASAIDVRTADGSVHIDFNEKVHLGMVNASEVTVQTAEGHCAFLLENAVAGLSGSTFTVLAEAIQRVEPETIPEVLTTL